MKVWWRYYLPLPILLFLVLPIFVDSFVLVDFFQSVLEQMWFLYQFLGERLLTTAGLMYKKKQTRFFDSVQIAQRTIIIREQQKKRSNGLVHFNLKTINKLNIRFETVSKVPFIEIQWYGFLERMYLVFWSRICQPVQKKFYVISFGFNFMCAWATAVGIQTTANSCVRSTCTTRN